MKNKVKYLLLTTAVIAMLMTAFMFGTSAAAKAPELESFQVTEQGNSSISLLWECSDKVTGYKLFTYDSSTKKTTLIKTFDAKTTQVKLTSLPSGTEYIYKLKAYLKSGDTTLYSNVLSATTYTTIPKIQNLSSTVTTNTVSLNWTAINGITTYQVYSLNKTTNKYKLLGTVTKNSATIKNANPATQYSFKVRATANATASDTIIYGGFAQISCTTKLADVKNFKSSSVSTATVSFSWSAVTGAKDYILYQYDSSAKKYKAVKKVTTTKCIVPSLTPGTAYKFKLRAYATADSTTVYSSYTSVITVVTKPAAVTVKQNVDLAGNGKVVLTWTKSSGATGYYIYISEHMNSGFDMKTSVSSGSTLTATLTGVKNGSVMYVKVVPYTNVNGAKTQGDASKIISVYA